jgi:hypothetical protein
MLGLQDVGATTEAVGVADRSIMTARERCYSYSLRDDRYGSRVRSRASNLLKRNVWALFRAPASWPSSSKVSLELAGSDPTGTVGLAGFTLIAAAFT